MKLTLYKNNSRVDRVDKTTYLHEPKNYEKFIFKKEQESNNPIIMLNDINANCYNYAFIDTLNTYYFIVEKNIINNNLIELVLHNDLLMTFKDKLLEQTAIISRQENIFDTYLIDNRVSVESYERIQLKKFPYGFTNTNASYVLAIAGGEKAHNIKKE